MVRLKDGTELSSPSVSTRSDISSTMKTLAAVAIMAGRSAKVLEDERMVFHGLLPTIEETWYFRSRRKGFSKHGSKWTGSDQIQSLWRLVRPEERLSPHQAQWLCSRKIRVQSTVSRSESMRFGLEKHSFANKSNGRLYRSYQVCLDLATITSRYPIPRWANAQHPTA